MLLLRHALPIVWRSDARTNTIFGMKSRVHPKYKTKYHVGNWPEYERALVRRGDITLWLSADAIAAWTPAPSGRRGGQRKFSDNAIETALALRLVFGLPLRQAEGFLRSVLSLMNVDLEAPDHTTLSRRSQHLNVRFHLVPPNEPLHLIVDSTGLSIVGQGEWAAVKHGGRGTRGWKKLHFGVDGSGAIVAHILTDESVDAKARRARQRDRQMDEAFEGRFDARGRWSTPPQPVDMALHHKEVETEIFACLEAAPLRQTLAFILREVEELSTEDICNVLGITRTNLGVMLHRIRNRVRDCLESKGVRR